jgi:enoyl-CoA hydratase
MSWILERMGSLALLQLTNAEQRNTLTPERALAIAEQVQALSTDPEVKVLAVTGQAKAFCAGADLPSLLAASQGDGRALHDIYQAFVSIGQSPLLTVALVNGAAVGAGFNLALCCDLRYANQDAWFESRFRDLALHQGGGHGWMLPKTVGWQQACSLLFAGERLDAQQAAACGLVQAVLPADQLLVKAQQIAAELSHVPTALLRQMKASMQQLLDCQHLSDAVAFEFRHQLHSLQQPAAQHAIAGLWQQLQQKNTEQR